MVVYFGTAFAIGGASLGMLRRNLKRGKTSPAVPEQPPQD
jgi:putative peptidoglycan lipid II flippase